MSIPFLTPIDLNKNELLNAVIQNLSSAPSSPAEAQIYYNTTDDSLYLRGPSGWLRLNNQTAAELLAALLTVDGSGTGLDADVLDGQQGAYYLARGNHTGTQTASTISDFDTQVRTNRLDQMATPTADVAFGSVKITGLADPTNTQDAATRGYVLNTIAAQLSGQDWKQSVRVASTANIDLSTALVNGALIDGVTVATGDRVLVKDQSNAEENGIYVVVAAGAASRSTDADTSSEVNPGLTVIVEEGTAGGDAVYLLTTNGAVTLGTTELTFTKLPGSSAYIGTANRITVTGQQIDIAATYVGQTSIVAVGTITTGTWQGTAVGVAYGGTGAATAPAARTNLGALGRYSTTIGNGSATSFNIAQATHGLAADGTNTVAVYDATSGAQVYPDVTVNPSTGQVTVAFSVAPTTNQYRVVIQGLTP